MCRVFQLVQNRYDRREQITILMLSCNFFGCFFEFVDSIGEFWSFSSLWPVGNIKRFTLRNLIRRNSCPDFYCSQCTVHHMRFCPVNLLLISWRALGSLDMSSGGTAVFFGTEPAVCENLLVFIRRWTKPDLPDECDALTLRGGCTEAVSSVTLLT